jgi:stage III sporulation protein AB
MEIFIYLAIIFCTTYIGFGIADYYVKREKLYHELVIFGEKLKSDIGFLLLPIGEILRGGAQQFGSSLAELIEASARLLGEGKPLSEAELFERWQTRLLLHDEKLFICRFFSMLGRSDEKTQLENIENYCERFKQRESECQNERKRYSPMFRKLGFLSGLAICLFLL